MVVILRSSSRDAQVLRPIFGSRTDAVRTDRRGGRRIHVPAIKPGLELLIGGKYGSVHHRVAPIRTVRAIASGTGRRTSHLSAIESPVEADPRHCFSRLIL